MENLLAALITGIQSCTLRVIDLTQTLNHGTPVISLPPQWAQTPPFRLRELSRYNEQGPFWYWNAFETGEHTGTHLDAPSHWATGRDLETVDAIPPKSLIGPAVVVDLVQECEKDPDTLLSSHHLNAWEEQHGPIPQGAWVLVRTGWDARFNDPQAYANVGPDGRPHPPGRSKEAAEFLTTQRDILGVGVETVGTDAGMAATFDPPFPNHNIMHGAGRMGLTSLTNLDQVPPSGAAVIALPLKIEGGSGSPMRAIALVQV